jgi:hypothetical protein
MKVTAISQRGRLIATHIPPTLKPETRERPSRNWLPDSVRGFTCSTSRTPRLTTGGGLAPSCTRS